MLWWILLLFYRSGDVCNNFLWELYSCSTHVIEEAEHVVWWCNTSCLGTNLLKIFSVLKDCIQISQRLLNFVFKQDGRIAKGPNHMVNTKHSLPFKQRPGNSSWILLIFWTFLVSKSPNLFLFCYFKWRAFPPGLRLLERCVVEQAVWDFFPLLVLTDVPRGITLAMSFHQNASMENCFSVWTDGGERRAKYGADAELQDDVRALSLFRNCNRNIRQY